MLVINKYFFLTGEKYIQIHTRKRVSLYYRKTILTEKKKHTLVYKVLIYLVNCYYECTMSRMQYFNTYSESVYCMGDKKKKNDKDKI